MASKTKKPRAQIETEYYETATKLCVAIEAYEVRLDKMHNIASQFMDPYLEDLSNVVQSTAGVGREIENEEYLMRRRDGHPYIKAYKDCALAISHFNSIITSRLSNLNEFITGKNQEEAESDSPVESRIFRSFSEVTAANTEKMKAAEKKYLEAVPVVMKALGKASRILRKASSELPLPYSEYETRGLSWHENLAKAENWLDRRVFLSEDFPKLKDLAPKL